LTPFFVKKHKKKGVFGKIAENSCRPHFIGVFDGGRLGHEAKKIRALWAVIAEWGNDVCPAREGICPVRTPWGESP